MPAITHEIVYGPFTKIVYTLTPERLRVETKGTIGGPSADVPVAAIRAFYAYSRRIRIGGPRSAALAATQHVSGTQSRFIVQWDESGTLRTKRFTLNANVPSFTALLQELARLRPDASLLPLPSEAAHARMGIWSLEKTTRVSMMIVIGALVAVAVIVGAIQGLQHG